MMKSTLSIILLLSLIGVTASVFAEIPMEAGPKIIEFKMGDLVLHFKHWHHQKSLDNKCSLCHTTYKSGKIENWNKETAHALCISCHETRKKGPTDCQRCHNSVYSRK